MLLIVVVNNSYNINNDKSSNSHDSTKYLN